MSSWGFRLILRLWQMRCSQPYCSGCDIAACSVFLLEAASLKQGSRTSSVLKFSPAACSSLQLGITQRVTALSSRLHPNVQEVKQI